MKQTPFMSFILINCSKIIKTKVLNYESCLDGNVLSKAMGLHLKPPVFIIMIPFYNFKKIARTFVV